MRPLTGSSSSSNMTEYTEILLRLVLATLAGGLIGLEREVKGKPAGFRTHAIVAMGSCIFTSLSLTSFGGDTGRIAAQIVSGIGFLGAGITLLTSPKSAKDLKNKERGYLESLEVFYH